VKAPRIAFNKDALLTFLLQHGEKMIAAVVGLAACALALNGVSALRSMRPTAEQQPEAIIADAAVTAEHIEAVKIAPDDELTSEKGLAATVAQWLAPKVEPPPAIVLLDKPLFAELARRSSPDILPIEELRAVAGVAVLAMKPKAVGDRQAPEKPLNLDAAQAEKPAKPPRGVRGRPMPPGPQIPQDMGMMPPGPEQALPQGKIIPYVLVTGLIPIEKQQEEYARRFDTASFRDATLDTPSWNGYQIEKTEVLPGTAEKWTPVDMKAVARRYSADWSGLFPEPFLPRLLLPVEQERRDPAVSPIPFCSPLPQLADGSWGLNALHPWFVAFLERSAAEQKAKLLADQETAAANTTVFGGAGPSFDGGSPPGFPPGFPPGPGMDSMTAPGMQGMPPGMDGQVADVPEYRLFRFVDLAVVPGRSYRYRVKSVCWNPNFNVPSRHLVETSVAKQLTVESPVSTATAPVAVPDGTRLLVQPTKKQDLKGRAGMIPVMILGEKPNAGAWGLRSLWIEAGGIVNVDPLQNKRGNPRSRGDAIVTDRVLLDVRGILEDRAETKPGKPTPPPEPLEMIFLRPDGTCEVASSAESQPDLDRYRSTLPADDAAAPGERPGQPPAAGGPFGNPFAPK